MSYLYIPEAVRLLKNKFFDNFASRKMKIREVFLQIEALDDKWEAFHAIRVQRQSQYKMIKNNIRQKFYKKLKQETELVNIELSNILMQQYSELFQFLTLDMFLFGNFTSPIHRNKAKDEIRYLFIKNGQHAIKIYQYCIKYYIQKQYWRVQPEIYSKIKLIEDPSNITIFLRLYKKLNKPQEIKISFIQKQFLQKVPTIKQWIREKFPNKINFNQLRFQEKEQTLLQINYHQIIQIEDSNLYIVQQLRFVFNSIYQILFRQLKNSIQLKQKKELTNAYQELRNTFHDIYNFDEQWEKTTQIKNFQQTRLKQLRKLYDIVWKTDKKNDQLILSIGNYHQIFKSVQSLSNLYNNLMTQFNKLKNYPDKLWISLRKILLPHQKEILRKNLKQFIYQDFFQGISYYQQIQKKHPWLSNPEKLKQYQIWKSSQNHPKMNNFLKILPIIKDKQQTKVKLKYNRQLIIQLKQALPQLFECFNNRTKQLYKFNLNEIIYNPLTVTFIIYGIREVTIQLNYQYLFKNIQELKTKLSPKLNTHNEVKWIFNQRELNNNLIFEEQVRSQEKQFLIINVSKQYQVEVIIIQQDDQNCYKFRFWGNQTVEAFIDNLQKKIKKRITDYKISLDISAVNKNQRMQIIIKEEKQIIMQLKNYDILLKFQYKCENYRIKNQEVQITKFITSHKSKNPNISLQLFALSGHPFNSKLFNPQQSIVVQQKIMPTPLKQFLERIQFNNQRKLRHSDIIRIEKQPIERNDLSLFDWLYKVEARNLRSNYEFLEFLNKQDIDGMDYKTFLVLVMQSYPDYRQEVLFNCVRFGIALPYIYQFPSGDAMRYKCKLDPFETIRLKNEFHLISVGSNCSMGKSTLLNKVFGTNFIVGRQAMIFGGIDVVTYYKQNLDTIKCNVFDVHQSYYLQRQNLKFLKKSINSQKVIFLIQVFNNEDAIRIEEEILKQWKPMKMIILYRDVKKNTVLPSSNNIRQIYGIPNLKQSQDKLATIALDLNLLVQKLKNQVNQILESQQIQGSRFKYIEMLKDCMKNTEICCSYEFQMEKLIQILPVLQGQSSIFENNFLNRVKQIISNRNKRQINYFMNMLQIVIIKSQKILNHIQNLSYDSYLSYSQSGNLFQILKTSQIEKTQIKFFKMFQLIQDNTFVISAIGQKSLDKSSVMNIIFNTNFKADGIEGMHFLFNQMQNNKIGFIDNQGFSFEQITSAQKSMVLNLLISNIILINFTSNQLNYILKIVGAGLFIKWKLFGEINKVKLIFFLRDMNNDINNKKFIVQTIKEYLKKTITYFGAKLENLLYFNQTDDFIFVPAMMEGQKYSKQFLKLIKKDVKFKLINIISRIPKINMKYSKWYQQLFINGLKKISEFKSYHFFDQLQQSFQKRKSQAISSFFIDLFINVLENKSTEFSDLLQKIKTVLINNNNKDQLSKNLKQKLQDLLNNLSSYTDSQENISQKLSKLKNQYLNQINSTLAFLIKQIKNQDINLNIIKQQIILKTSMEIEKLIGFHEIKFKIKRKKLKEKQVKKNIELNIQQQKKKLLRLARNQNLIGNIDTYLTKFTNMGTRLQEQIKNNQKNTIITIKDVEKIFKLVIHVIPTNQSYFSYQQLLNSLKNITQLQKQKLVQQSVTYEKVVQRIKNKFQLNASHHSILGFSSQDLSVEYTKKINDFIVQIIKQMKKQLQSKPQMHSEIIINLMKGRVLQFINSNEQYKTNRALANHLLNTFTSFYYFFIKAQKQMNQLQQLTNLKQLLHKKLQQISRILQKIQQNDKVVGQDIGTSIGLIIKSKFQKQIQSKFLDKLSTITLYDVKSISDKAQQHYFLNGTSQQVQQYLNDPKQMIQKIYSQLFQSQYKLLIQQFRSTNFTDQYKKIIETYKSLIEKALKNFRQPLIKQKLQKAQELNNQIIEKLYTLNRKFFIQFFSVGGAQQTLIKIYELLGVDIKNIKYIDNTQEINQINNNCTEIIENYQNFNIINPIYLFEIILKTFKNLTQSYLQNFNIMNILSNTITQSVLEIKQKNCKDSIGCMQLCPYCAAKCNNNQKNHNFHSTTKHRYVAFKGVHQVRDDKKYFQFYPCNCQFNIHDNKYSNNSAKQVLSQEISKIRKQLNVSQGRLTITLKWETNQDIDLHCTCPCGSNQQVYYGNKVCRVCKNTELDIDMTSFSSNPTKQKYCIENIFFKTSQYKQKYVKAWIEMYSKRTGEGIPSKFTVYITYKTETKTVTSSIESTLKINKQIFYLDPIQIIRKEFLRFQEHNIKFNQNKKWIFDKNSKDGNLSYDLDRIWKGWLKVSSILQKKYGVIDGTQGKQPHFKTRVNYQ